MTAFQTEFEFTLPRGFIDDAGKVHRTGTMRLATASDEILPLRDPRVTTNQAYLVILLLSRVITSLGSLPAIGVSTVERLFSADLAYLQDFYRRINETGTSRVKAVCPQCQTEFEVEVTPQGGSRATPSTSSTRR
jgi:hypothetical protein